MTVSTDALVAQVLPEPLAQELPEPLVLRELMDWMDLRDLRELLVRRVVRGIREPQVQPVSAQRVLPERRVPLEQLARRD